MLTLGQSKLVKPKREHGERNLFRQSLEELEDDCLSVAGLLVLPEEVLL